MNYIDLFDLIIMLFGEFRCCLFYLDVIIEIDLLCFVWVICWVRCLYVISWFWLLIVLLFELLDLVWNLEIELLVLFYCIMWLFGMLD